MAEDWTAEDWQGSVSIIYGRVMYVVGMINSWANSVIQNFAMKMFYLDQFCYIVNNYLL